MKILRMLFLLSCGIGLNACKSTSTVPPAQPSENKAVQGIPASGTIGKQGVTTYQYGTHVLNDKEGKTIYALKSETLKLDAYTGKKVELTGVPVEGYPIEGGPVFLEVVKIKEQ